MGFSHFRFQILIRVVIQALTAIMAGWAIQLGSWLPALVLSVAFTGQSWSLIRYLERTNRDLTRFLEAIRYADFAQSFTTPGLGRSFDQLHQAFSDVIKEFHKSRSEKEESNRYLQTVIQHLGTGLLAFRPDGTVDLVNQAARKLLRLAEIRHLRSLTAISPELTETLLRLRPGEKALIRLHAAEEPVQLAIYATEFKLRDQQLKLVSLQDIYGELEQQETEAWQKLTRVLTHEIMNSMTPIASLAATAQDLVKGLNRPGPETGGTADDQERLQDVSEAVETIHRRSLGLMDFVQAYRNLALLPKPRFQIIPVQELFRRVETLMQSAFLRHQILFRQAVDPESLELTADPSLVEQVLINLLLNAVDAVQGRPAPRIELKATLNNRGRVLIKVIDNGPGVAAEAKEKIFIPFFTTKSHGSGIGLSFSRQVMHLHKGAIILRSEPDVETSFTLRF